MLKRAEAQSDKKEPVVIKKYANRRLYNTETSTYVTLDDLAQMVKGERDFVVYDAKTGDDLTHSVLTQIIMEQESRSEQTLLPVPFLRQLIRFYGGNIEKLVPSYLQFSLDMFTREQERFRSQFSNTFGTSMFEAYQEQAKKNLALFEQAMSMFTPFGPLAGRRPETSSTGSPPTGEPSATPASQPAGTPSAARAAVEFPPFPSVLTSIPTRPATPAAQPSAQTQELQELKAQLAAMQAKIEKMSGTN
ncbi:MAG TPA: polyhydroxyalkanoate synthesis repressor PhaR [Hyphomicrobiaceae bacterium]|nr:polyhydroxyalkanoate synthesis repressor PhaR [Hyphomicrobiaceae bacterium]